MGQNLYGYDWTLPFVQGGPIAKAHRHPIFVIQMPTTKSMRSGSKTLDQFKQSSTSSKS
ncbi:hypothetical protein CGLO_14019 [Colletotrichum gloeosporioides Cg-14]|uniref:Uncharacterized protein n=1 Tax=Colletotrichum gloeosporioides (strain Cg-14) TaxID=1237896 RepID=T0K2E1_COLGC|nr:hypothetical protein CGLO_14019 [Colletotrichum gloeosporioides Cg-14]